MSLKTKLVLGGIIFKIESKYIYFKILWNLSI